MKYKVGDKVKIKSFEWYIKNKDLKGEIGCSCQKFVKNMSGYCGDTATIISVLSHKYTLDIDEGYWAWDDLMFEDDYLNEADYNCVELKDTIEVIKEKRFNAACSAMNGIVSGLMQSEEWHGWTDKYIAERAYLLADELLKQGGFNE